MPVRYDCRWQAAIAAGLLLPIGFKLSLGRRRLIGPQRVERESGTTFLKLRHGITVTFIDGTNLQINSIEKNSTGNLDSFLKTKRSEVQRSVDSARPRGQSSIRASQCPIDLIQLVGCNRYEQTVALLNAVEAVEQAIESQILLLLADHIGSAVE